MTRGALIFAYNNEEIDYVKLAAWSATNIHKHLKIPVAVVTDSANVPDVFDTVIHVPRSGTDQRYFEDIGTSVTWYNGNRSDAYGLSPWDQTLVLDADYVVCHSRLSMLFNASEDFLCHTSAFDISKTNDFSSLNFFGKGRLPMAWATVMYFTESNTASYIFDCMQMIKNNWRHYRDLYGINQKTFRNDYALSIALALVNGQTGQVSSIPWALASLLPEHKLTVTQVSEDRDPVYRIEYTDSRQQTKHFSWTGLDFHAMGKRHLEAIIEASS
jgi:hypothetical protein